MHNEIIHEEYQSRRDTWTGVVGDLWAHVFQAIDLPQNGVVVEVAPGDEPKIGLGLARVGFHGTVYLIEPHQATGTNIAQRYRACTDATVHLVRRELANAMSEIPSQIDALVANHPLDDMILAKGLSSRERETLFTDHYRAPFERTRHAWDRLTADDAKLQRCIAAVVDEWSDAIQTMQPRTTAISQYRSRFFETNGFQTADDIAIGALRTLEGRYDHRVNRAAVPPGVVEPSLWLIF